MWDRKLPLEMCYTYQHVSGPDHLTECGMAQSPNDVIMHGFDIACNHLNRHKVIKGNVGFYVKGVPNLAKGQSIQPLRIGTVRSRRGGSILYRHLCSFARPSLQLDR